MGDDGEPLTKTLQCGTSLPAASRDLCRRCALVQKTCCQDSEVYVTLGDIERIRACTGEDAFCDFKPPQNSRYTDQDDDPVWRDMVMGRGNARRILRKRDNGDCHFLSPTGCRLSLDARPLVCRLYPYSYSEKGIEGVDAYRCPAEFLSSGREILSALGMDDFNEVLRWHATLYAEIRCEHGAVSREPAKEPVATMR
jgi:Fe-S-cluster containining protein